MKILYVITKSNWGGAQKYVFDLSASIPNSIVAFGGDGILKKKLEERGIRTIQIKNLGRNFHILNDLKVFFELLQIFKKEKPDVVHLNSSKIGAIGSLAGRIAGIEKVIFTAHGWAFNEKRNIFSKIIIWKISFLTSLLSTDIIVLSEKEREQSKKLLLTPKRKIHLIRNGIKKKRLLTREEALDKLGLSIEKKYVGTISELHKNKGLETLLKSQINSNLVIIGSGEEEANLKKMAQNLGISHKVYFLGSIENAGIYLKAFDVFTLTSIKEGLPYALLEAGYAGIPSVASNVGGVPEIIIDKKTGFLIESNNPGILKEKVEKLLNNQEEAWQMGSKAKEHVNKKFTFEKMLQETIDTYK